MRGGTGNAFDIDLAQAPFGTPAGHDVNTGRTGGETFLM
jgi:hypothetical protein